MILLELFLGLFTLFTYIIYMKIICIPICLFLYMFGVICIGLIGILNACIYLYINFMCKRSLHSYIHL